MARRKFGSFIFIILLSFYTTFAGAISIPKENTIEVIVYKGNNDWITVYNFKKYVEYGIYQPIAKLPRDNAFLDLNSPKLAKNKDYLYVAVIGLPIKGLIKKDVLTQAHINAGFELYTLIFMMYYQDSYYSNDGLRPFFSTRLINENTVSIQLSTIWPDITTNKQKELEQLALSWWSGANKVDRKDSNDKYCVEYYLDNKLIDKLCKSA